MPDSGKASKELVLGLSRNIARFNEIVTEKIKDIERDSANLSDDWDDPQYQEFLSFTSEITKQLQKDIAILESIEKNLRKKADLFS